MLAAGEEGEEGEDDEVCPEAEAPLPLAEPDPSQALVPLVLATAVPAQAGLLTQAAMLPPEERKQLAEQLMAM